MIGSMIEGMVRSAGISQPEMRDRILDSAESMFRRFGYLKVTVADIAHDLGMSPANVYRFFDSKATLRQTMAARLTGQVEEACRNAAQAPGSVSERMSAMLVEYHRMTLDRYIISANVHEMLGVAMMENWQVINVHAQRMQEIIRGLIDEGVESGEFKVRDAECAARMYYYAICVFIDPTHVARLFLDDGMTQVAEMNAFLLGALKSGNI
jgi:AcrR family transcriptional regulator